MCGSLAAGGAPLLVRYWASALALVGKLRVALGRAPSRWVSVAAQLGDLLAYAGVSLELADADEWGWLARAALTTEASTTAQSIGPNGSPCCTPRSDDNTCDPHSNRLGRP